MVLESAKGHCGAKDISENYEIVGGPSSSSRSPSMPWTGNLSQSIVNFSSISYSRDNSTQYTLAQNKSTE